MKSLLDLQQAIRTLEHDISWVMKNVQALYDDIDEMRNTCDYIL